MNDKPMYLSLRRFLASPLTLNNGDDLMRLSIDEGKQKIRIIVQDRDDAKQNKSLTVYGSSFEDVWDTVVKALREA